MTSMGTLFKGTITYVAVVENRNGQKQLEVGLEVNERLLSMKPEEGSEPIPTIEVQTYLHLDDDGDPEKKRQSITRDRIAKLTDTELTMDWESDTGWLRLCSDHPKSIVSALEGREVLLKSREWNDRTYYDLYFARSRPKALSIAEVKAKLRPF